MLKVFCDHPGAGFLSPTQWLGVVRVNISVIKILTQPGRGGQESKVQISPHSWYEAVNWSQSSLAAPDGVKRSERFPLWCVVCWPCYRRPLTALTIRYFISHTNLTSMTEHQNIAFLSPVTRPVPPRGSQVSRMTQIHAKVEALIRFYYFTLSELSVCFTMWTSLCWQIKR